MDNNNYYDDRFDNEVPYEADAAESENTTALALTAPSYAVTESIRFKGSKQIAREAAAAECREKNSAALAATAKFNVAKLSMLERNLNEIAPEGKQEYKAIKDAYTISAIDRIMRSGRI